MPDSSRNLGVHRNTGKDIFFRFGFREIRNELAMPEPSLGVTLECAISFIIVPSPTRVSHYISLRWYVFCEREITYRGTLESIQLLGSRPWLRPSTLRF